jgi:hypothetical protein
MKKLTFLFLIVLLLCFNYAHSQDNNLKKVIEKAIKEVTEEIIKICKEDCKIQNSPRFCKRICEEEIFDPRWEFLGFDVHGSAHFYDPKSIFISDGIVKVWRKTIHSEKDKQNLIKRLSTKYQNLDRTLTLLKIDCSKRRAQY